MGGRAVLPKTNSLESPVVVLLLGFVCSHCVAACQVTTWPACCAGGRAAPGPRNPSTCCATSSTPARSNSTGVSRRPLSDARHPSSISRLSSAIRRLSAVGRRSLSVVRRSLSVVSHPLPVVNRPSLVIGPRRLLWCQSVTSLFPQGRS